MFVSMDFGTSYSQVATVKNGSPVLLHPPGEYGIPTGFYYDNDNGILVGQDAFDAGQGDFAKNLNVNFKMKLSKTFASCGRTFSSIEMVSEIYKALLFKAKKIADVKGYDSDIEGVVLTAPVRFGAKEREMLKNAAQDTSTKPLNVKAIIKEPVAAAIYYFHKSLEKKRNILVFDLGGGTCDVAIVKSSENKNEYYEVVDSDMVELGGRNWDEELQNLIVIKLKTDFGVDVSGNEGAKEKIRREAIKAKHILSDGMHDITTIRIELNGRIFPIKISLEEFDELTLGLLNSCIDCLVGLYNKHSYDISIDDVICVGGSSNMLQIKREISKKFPKVNVSVFDPEYAVVSGAAIYADLLKDNGSHLLDKASFSYGVRCYDYKKDKCFISNLIFKGDSLPKSHSGKYFVRNTEKLETVSATYTIYENDSSDRAIDIDDRNVKKIGVMRATHRSKKCSDVDLDITFTLTSSGLLTCKVYDENKQIVENDFEIESF